ncbi:hypothetical protein AB3N59_02215 [Leptospira sp. WS92.C1]
MKNELIFSNPTRLSLVNSKGRCSFDPKFVYRVICPILLLVSLFAVSACKQSPKDQVQKILSNKQIPVEEKIRQTSFLLLGDRLKEIEISPAVVLNGSTSDQVKVTLAVGGNSALTFLEQKEYKERMKLEVALLSFRLLQTLKELPIESLRISIIKPYYVKNSKQEYPEEFEVFRAKLEKASLASINGFETVDSFAADSYDSPDPEVLDVMIRIVHSWKVELDELGRVEID